MNNFRLRIFIHSYQLHFFMSINHLGVTRNRIMLIHSLLTVSRSSSQTPEKNISSHIKAIAGMKKVKKKKNSFIPQEKSRLVPLVDPGLKRIQA